MKVPQPQRWVAETEVRQADNVCSGLILSFPGLARVGKNLEVPDGWEESEAAFVIEVGSVQTSLT